MIYAVLHVSDFSLQAVLRADPNLGIGAAAELAERQPLAGDPADAGQRPALLSEGADTRTPGGRSPRSALETRVESGAVPPHSKTEAPPGSAGVPPASDLLRPRRPRSQEELPLFAPIPPPPSDTPFAVLSGDTKKAVVLQANALARAAGVTPGMSAPQAQARCATIVFCQPSSSADREAQQLLLACALDVAPSVEDTAPGICTIDVTGLPAEERSRHVAHALCQLREHGLTATGGIAATPLLALYAARDTTSVRTVENAPAFLHRLPLAVAEPSGEQTSILAGWGITTLGQFTALPKPDVVRRLGTEGFALWERARGGEPRPLRPYAPAQRFAASMEFEYEIETTEGVLFILRRFIDRLALELRTAGLVAGELVLGLGLADETTHERGFRLPEPTAREDILFRTLFTYLESLRTGSAVVGVSLRVLPARPLVRQPGLFETGLLDPHGFSETLARVTAVVGSGQLGTPELEDTYRPDAVKLVPPLPLVPAMDQPPTWPSTGLPLRRCRPPPALHVELTRSGQPAFVSGAQLHSPVAAARGPWRTSGDWWKPESWSRDEWDIELAAGGLYRIAKIGEEWYLDGEYE
ncbi:hypothetical protein DB347_18725 [Opitutaceae bacterium EW11]|nr:hypothetical protein DB347_18725 [Opitutaceae bacterium EW11]